MSKKRILNATSRKKRDTMLTWSNTTNSGAARSPAVGPLFVNGSQLGTFLWVATARDLTPGTTGGLATVANESSRTASTCYMRGLSEHIRIQTSSGVPWFHRRICFTSKGQSLVSPLAGDTGALFPYLETSNGMVRPFINITIDSTLQNYRNNLFNVVFKGQEGVDWNDIVSAPLDTRRISVKFDKTWTLHSGNTNGIVRERKLWHGMNHNLVYDDDESGLTEAPAFYSTDSKAGMGDYYVLDLIVPGTSATSSDAIRLETTSSLYWHEK